MKSKQMKFKGVRKMFQNFKIERSNSNELEQIKEKKYEYLREIKQGANGTESTKEPIQRIWKVQI